METNFSKNSECENTFFIVKIVIINALKDNIGNNII